MRTTADTNQTNQKQQENCQLFIYAVRVFDEFDECCWANDGALLLFDFSLVFSIFIETIGCEFNHEFNILHLN